MLLILLLLLLLVLLGGGGLVWAGVQLAIVIFVMLVALSLLGAVFGRLFWGLPSRSGRSNRKGG